MDLEKRLLDIVAGERMTEKDFEQFYKYGDILALVVPPVWCAIEGIQMVW